MPEEEAVIRRLLYELRFIRWMWRYPNMGGLVARGVNHDSRRIIYDRYDEKAPKP